MYRRPDPLALDPLGPIEAFSSPAGSLGLDPLSPIQTSERHDMKIVVIGGSGLIGSKLVTKRHSPRREQAHADER